MRWQIIAGIRHDRQPPRARIPCVIPKLPPDVFIGCAGWNIPRAEKSQFPAAGSHLERYAAGFRAVEINSSFYRPHQRATYERWAVSVPDDFRFAVKLPRTITHDARLQGTDPLLERFCGEVAGLGDRLGVLLVQLPPSLAYEKCLARDFFILLRQCTSAPLALEPRHASWFVPHAADVLRKHDIVLVQADPPPIAGAPLCDVPGTLRYHRLHGSPRMYYSEYQTDFLQALAKQMTSERCAGHAVWCIFDNTALGHAMGNARELARLMATGRAPLPASAPP